MADILTEIKAKLPKDKEVTNINFEAANIIVYTKNKDFFLDNKGLIRTLVGEFKKRIELRPDPSIIMDLEKAEKEIKKIIPKEADISEITFDPQRSSVIIEAKKPGSAIGQSGENLKQIREKTLWVPLVKRTPGLKSKIIENIRKVLYENNDYRTKFLNQTGKRIYSDWVKGKKKGWVRTSFLGGGRQVGRSCILVQTSESRVLLDCGINPSANKENTYPYFDCPDFKVNEIDAVIVSHPHLDHSAMIPLLVKYGYTGPIYCTAPTRDIMALLALDYISIGFKEMQNAPYKTIDVKQMVKQTICLNYEEVSDITPDIRITLYNAGHTLGSAMVHLHIGNGLHNLLYTGDFNFERTRLLAPASTKFPRLETVIIESTYGAKDDILPTRKECEDYLLKIIKDTNKRGGKVLMPVLGVGRSQEVMLILEELMTKGTIPKMPIYVQGMVWDITAIHTAYPDFFNPSIRKAIFHENKNPFLSDVFTHVGSHKDMQKVIDSKEPCIIMATSGMMVGGASVEYFKALAENPKHSMVMSCYQPEGSLGRRLQNGEKEIAFSVSENRSEITKVKCEIHTIQGFSNHSSRSQLMAFLHKLNPKPKRIIVNHGESSKCLDLASSAHKTFRVETNAPRNLDGLRIR
tara:strand:- start:1380 stop:3281 length:1902 start_codon:yes stop_codon:yes gene_type:complete